MVANEDSQTSLLASTTLDAWATTPSTWRRNSEIEFRVRRKGQPTRRLRLPGARYTLGSGTGCSIQLEDASLRPLHAVLIRDDERILVRAYSIPFQINNRRMSEGLLSVGDRLSLGAYEFELLENAPDAVTSSSQSLALGMFSGDEPGVTRDDVSHHEQSRAFHEEAKQWRALKHDAQQREAWCQTREHELQEQQGSLQKQLEMLQKREANLQTQESAAAEVHGELQHNYQELLQHRDELKVQQKELVTGREHLRLQQERLDGRDRLHRQQVDRLIGEQEEFKRVETHSQQKLAESEEQLHASHQQAEAATSAVAQMREKFALLSQQLTELTTHQASLKQLEAQRADEHRQRTDELEFARDEALAERNYASAQRDNVTTQRDEMTVQRDQITAQRDDFAIQRDDLAAERDDIAIERDEIAACCQELELIQDQLRAEIEQLQGEIAHTRLQAETLDQDCRAGRQTIASLEETIREQGDRYEFDRQSWTNEVDALRKNIDELSLELEHAQAQLTALREDNTQLSEQLTGATEQRDQARAERETAIEQCQAAQAECQAAQLTCDTAKMDCESARRELETARADVKLARQERDEAAAYRDEILAQRDEILAQRDELTVHHDEVSQQHDELSLEQATWAEQKSQAERRYQEARTHLADAREKCERAVRARDAANAARLEAEEKLAIATADLQAMQVERDEAIAGQNNLRRQRDDAIEDAKNTRELFDRSNRDHDDTLEMIERLEQKTRELVGSITLDPMPEDPSRLSLPDDRVDAAVDHHAPLDAENDSPTKLSTQTPSTLSEPFDTDDAWPTYSSDSDKPENHLENAVLSAPDEPVDADGCPESALAQATNEHPVDECTNDLVNIALPLIDSRSDDRGNQEHEHAAPPAPALSIAATNDDVSEVVSSEADANSNADASSQDAADDDSIEAYMNRLLQRVQGRITDVVPVAVADTEPDDTQEQEPSSVVAKSTMAIAEPRVKPLQSDDSPIQNAQTAKKPKFDSAAPKRNNSPARSTIIRSQKSTGQTTRARAMMKYAQVGIALLCGVAAVVLVNLPMLKIVAAVAAVLIAAICAKEALAFQTEVSNPSSSRRSSGATDITTPKAAA